MRVKKTTDAQPVKWWAVAQDEPKSVNLDAPFKFSDERCQNVFNDWAMKFSDDWVNNVANVNANNSIARYSDFVVDRLNYSECATLSTDSIINNAISKYANEILRRGGKIKVELEDIDTQAQIEKMLNERLKELHFWDSLRDAITTSLTYGGSLVFIDTNAEDLEEPLYESGKIAKVNKIQGLRVVPPYLFGAVDVETANPLSADFMKPTKWYVSGNDGLIHNSRFLRLVFFEAPALLKPLYNFMGVSLCQFMRNYVASADIARQSLADIFLRFKTTIIRSDMVKINALEAKERALSINRQFNNLGSLLLTKDEEYLETITPLTGLDKLVAQMLENIAVSARMPAVKLLGLTPSGFNATGDFDLNSYYDEIMSLQNAIIKPLIDRVLRILSLEQGLDIYPSYEFEVLQKISEQEQTINNNGEADLVGKLLQNGVITPEQAFEYLKDKDIIKAEFDYQVSDDEFDALMEQVSNGGQESTETENARTDEV